MPTGVYKRSAEHIRKLHAGGPWNKGMHGISDKTRMRMRLAKLGRLLPEEHRRNISQALMGRTVSEEVKRKISNSEKTRVMPIGTSAYNWRGGRTNRNHAIRNSEAYKLWRTAVFVRDNYTCVQCGQKGGKLNADHIQPFACYPELRLIVDNGRTLCVDCHRKTPTFSGKGIKRDHYVHRNKP